MTEINVIARPYAHAAFDYALAHNTLPMWQTMLAGLSECVSNPKVQWILQSPRYTPEQAGERILTLMKDILNPACQRFVQLLALNKRLSFLPAINDLFVGLYRAHQQILPVDVITATPLNEDDKQALAKALTAKFASQVELVYHIDPAILGGVMVRTGDKVIDGSFAGQLARLKQTLVA